MINKRSAFSTLITVITLPYPILYASNSDTEGGAADAGTSGGSTSGGGGGSGGDACPPGPKGPKGEDGLPGTML